MSRTRPSFFLYLCDIIFLLLSIDMSCRGITISSLVLPIWGLSSNKTNQRLAFSPRLASLQPRLGKISDDSTLREKSMKNHENSRKVFHNAKIVVVLTREHELDRGFNTPICGASCDKMLSMSPVERAKSATLSIPTAITKLFRKPLDDSAVKRQLGEGG